MFHGDLLLASTAMMVEPLCQRHHGSGSFVGKLQIFGSCREKLRRLRPSLYIASAASLAAINWAINIPSTGSAGAISMAP